MPFSDPTPAAPRRTTPSAVRRTPGRAVAAGLGALVLLAAGAPALPAASGASASASQATTALRTSSTAGPGVVTPEMQAEIDRVVREGLSARVPAGASTRTLADAAARCATFDGQRYCLGTGWTTSTEREVAARMAAGTPAGRERTGDLDPATALRQQARMTPTARAAAERLELTAAAKSVAKVWLLRHEIQGVPLPADFAQRHPEALASTQARDTTTTGTTTTSTTATTAAVAPAAPSPKTAADYPETFQILKQKQVRPQQRYYWCGPGAMQMIAWGWDGSRRNQAHWAGELGTTSAGTSITAMVQTVNESTGWGGADYAGEYIVLDIGDFTFKQWYLLMMKHVHDYRAPVVLHPILLKQYYPYLDDDASGHFQVGRGFDQNPGGRPKLGYFEPWDQSKFDPSEPRIARTQWQNAYKSFRANQAHFQHNVGV
ncbi:C39 family peptidase [Nocardioides sp. Soil805]|uniref:C39 family peptidase n=1 Tax=Nocardioides sp. Soil805 TaxID=1736416 RepID=UPI000AF0C4FE|nr:C39 family peptidase [Nocardioides sp. Soil805]